MGPLQNDHTNSGSHRFMSGWAGGDMVPTIEFAY